MNDTTFEAAKATAPASKTAASPTTPHTCFYCTHRSITHSCSDGQCRVIVFCKLTGDETSNGATCPEWEERKEKC